MCVKMLTNNFHWVKISQNDCPLRKKQFYIIIKILSTLFTLFINSVRDVLSLYETLNNEFDISNVYCTHRCNMSRVLSGSLESEKMDSLNRHFTNASIQKQDRELSSVLISVHHSSGIICASRIISVWVFFLSVYMFYKHNQIRYVLEREGRILSQCQIVDILFI